MSQNQSQGKTRNSSVELLRILAILSIVFHHFAYHGEFEWAASSVTLPHLWYNFLIMIGKIGVNVFIIITGYYMIKSDKDSIRLEKIAAIWGQVFFYSALIYAVFALTGRTDTGLKSLVRNLLPLTFGQWWFASAYFVLYIMHPFLNKLLRSMNKIMYQRFLLVLVVCWSVIPTFTTSAFESNSLLWFVTLYSIAGYIRLYGRNPRFTAKFYGTVFLVGSALLYAASVGLLLLGTRWPVFASFSTYVFGQEHITVLCLSLSLFLIFIDRKMEYHPWINTAASATFGVYLIHDSPIFRQFLWLDLFRNAQYRDILLLIPYSILVVFSVYAGCTAVELLRQRIIEKPFLQLVKLCSDKLNAPFDRTVAKLKGFVFGD